MSSPKKTTDGDPGKPGKTFEPEIPAEAQETSRVPAGAKPTEPLPRVARLDFEALARDAVPESDFPDPGERGKVMNEANRMEPLRQIQTSFDQTVHHAENVRRGEPWVFPGSFATHAQAAREYARHRAAVLRAAADMAEGAVKRIDGQLSEFEAALAARQPG